MKRLLVYCLALVFTISGCKKGPKNEDEPVKPGETETPAGPDGKGGSIPATADIYLFGKNGSPNFNYILWAGATKLENFLDYDLSAMAIEGLFIQGNPNNQNKTVNFFGSHALSQNKYRISYYSKSKYYHLAEALNVPISTNFTEGFIAYAFHQKNLYMLAHSFGNGTMQYYYKVTEKGNFSVQDLLPNIDYKFIAGSSNGAILAVPDTKLLFTEVGLYRDKTFIDNFKIEMDDYSYITLLDLQMLNEESAFFTASARKDSDGSIRYLYVVINLNTKAVRTFVASNIPVGSTVGNVVVNQGKAYIPVTVSATNDCYYLTLSFTGSNISTQQTALEKQGTQAFHADQLFIDGTDIYVQGGEGYTACYWKNNKLVRIPQGTAAESYVYDIRK